VPALGQHTDAILAGLGYGTEAIASLRAASAV
jgi:crotonobetainyl-CoA:carnitine CoA-transferase CaiB-like acyl-CoA transferase